MQQMIWSKQSKIKNEPPSGGFLFFLHSPPYIKLCLTRLDGSKGASIERHLLGIGSQWKQTQKMTLVLHTEQFKELFRALRMKN